MARKTTMIHERLASVIPGTPVAKVVVDDPYAEIPGERVLVYRHLRNDPVAAMHVAGQIKDAELMAARRWQRTYERAEIGGARAIDPTKERVDGGQAYDSLSPQRMAATAELAQVRAELGSEGDGIVRDILGLELTIAAAAQKRGWDGEPRRKYLGQRFRECLHTLCVFYGYVTRESR